MVIVFYLKLMIFVIFVIKQSNGISELVNTWN